MERIARNAWESVLSLGVQVLWVLLEVPMDCWLNRLLYAEAGEMRHRLCLVGDYLRTLRILGTLTTWRRLCITAVQTHMMRTARPKLRATTSIIAEAMALLLWQCDAPHQVRSGGENMYKPLLCCHFDLFWSCRQFGGLFLYCTEEIGM